LVTTVERVLVAILYCA